jgi:hypothetical protein
VSTVLRFPPPPPPPTEAERWNAVAFICASIGDPELELALLKILHDQWFRDVPDHAIPRCGYGELQDAKSAVKILLYTLIQNRENPDPERYREFTNIANRLALSFMAEKDRSP